MSFEINGKVAIITGGASGIGYCFGKELLQNGLRGLTIADIDEAQGQKALDELQNIFEPDKIIFISTDVRNATSFEDAFKVTVEKFGNIDVLLNCAGILNDAEWEKEIAININGTVNGTILGLEHYISNHKTGSEGVIINMSSVCGARPSFLLPIYSATKSAILSLSQSFGHENHFQRTGVRVVAVCPGPTDTAIFDDFENHFLTKSYLEYFSKVDYVIPKESPESVAKHMVDVVKKAPTGTSWICEGGKPYQEISPKRNTVKKIYLN